MFGERFKVINFQFFTKKIKNSQQAIIILALAFLSNKNLVMESEKLLYDYINTNASQNIIDLYFSFSVNYIESNFYKGKAQKKFQFIIFGTYINRVYFLPRINNILEILDRSLKKQVTCMNPSIYELINLMRIVEMLLKTKFGKFYIKKIKYILQILKPKQLLKITKVIVLFSFKLRLRIIKFKI